MTKPLLGGDLFEHRADCEGRHRRLGCGSYLKQIHVQGHMGSTLHSGESHPNALCEKAALDQADATLVAQRQLEQRQMGLPRRMEKPQGTEQS